MENPTRVSERIGKLEGNPARVHLLNNLLDDKRSGELLQLLKVILLCVNYFCANGKR